MRLSSVSMWTEVEHFGTWIWQKDWLTLCRRSYRNWPWPWAWNIGIVVAISSAAHQNLQPHPLESGTIFEAQKKEPEATHLIQGDHWQQQRTEDSAMLAMEIQLSPKFILALVIIIFWTVFWLIHIIGIIYGYRKLHRRRAVPLDDELGVTGVSILKPLVGSPMDPNLMMNLETFFTMNYPKYELLFCVQDESDPSIMIVHQLQKKHPHVDCQLFTGGATVGVNPKINNMQPGYGAAKHELLLISDSSLLMKEDTLSDMVQHMTPDVGIVHQMPFTCDRKGWPAVLEKVFFGTGHARMYLFLGFLDAMGLAVHCCTGMSCLMRKKILDQAGGLSEFGKYLAEDYFFAKYIQDAGWGIRISSQPAWQNSGISKVKNFLSRIERWCKLRMAMVPHTIILEPLSECMMLGLVASWAAVTLFQADYLSFFLTHTLVWFCSDWLMLIIVNNGPPPFSKFEFVISWLFRETSALFIFLHANWDPVISWRNNAYKLNWNGVAEPVTKRGSVI